MFPDRNEVSIKDIMTVEVNYMNLNSTVEDAFKFMVKKGIDNLLVVNESKEMVGVIDFFYLLKNFLYNKKQQSLKKIVRKNFDFVKEIDDVSILIKNIKSYKNSVLPVLNEKKLVGVIDINEVLVKCYINLETTNSKLDNIINTIHEAVCAVDEEGIVRIWNKNAEKLYSVLEKDIIGKNIEKFFPHAAINTVRKYGKAIKNKYHSPRTGSHIVTNALPIYVEGSFRGVVSTDRDVTEIKNLSSELEKANRKLTFLEEEVKKYSVGFGNIIGNSEKIRIKIELAKQVSPTDASVIVTGESGTGKEMFSRAIHDASMRSGLFVPVNCSAIPNELFESELFGYSPGAFTGANKKGKMGIFELANNGTVFLDEIGEMPLYMQAKLLRVLQEKEIRRVGGEKSIKLNVRIISATNKDLKLLVEKGEFREDLYYRLNVVEIYLPPLRERKEDIPLYIDYFLKELAIKNSKSIPKINDDVLNMLKEYHWKGNLRELKNTIEHLIVVSKCNSISVNSVPDYILKQSYNKKQIKTDSFDLVESTRKLELENIKKALKICNNNKAKAAKILNIPRSTLYYKMEQYNIKVSVDK